MTSLPSCDCVKYISPAEIQYRFDHVWTDLESSDPISLDDFFTRCFGYEYDGTNQEDKRRRSYIWNLILKKIRNGEALKVYMDNLKANHIMKSDVSKFTTIEKVTITWNQIGAFRNRITRAKLIERIKSAWELEVTDRYIGNIINEVCQTNMAKIEQQGKKHIIVLSKKFVRTDVDELIDRMKKRNKKKITPKEYLKEVYGATSGPQSKLFDPPETIMITKIELKRLHNLIRKQAEKITFLTEENIQLKNLIPIMPKEMKKEASAIISETELKQFEEMVE